MEKRLARFGTFEVDFRAGELRRRGERFKLQQQPLQVLAMLLQHPGELVTREELQKKLWPGDTDVDFDDGVNKAIAKIRAALRDSAESPRFVETLDHRGYRFISNAPMLSDDPPVTTSRGLARGLFLLIQVGYLAMYGVAFYFLPAIQHFALFLPLSHVLVYVISLALCGTALRLYLLSAVAFDYSHSGRLFQRLFPGILFIDLVWSLSPLLLFHRLGQLVQLFVGVLAFLPFAQRSLLLAAYSPGGGRTSTVETPGSP